MRRLAFVRNLMVDALKGMSVEEFRRHRHLPEYEVTPERVLHHLRQHEAEHRSEIARLLLDGRAAIDEEQYVGSPGK